MIENICTNRISIKYYGDQEHRLEVSRKMLEVLEKHYKVVFNERNNEGNITECVFESKWTCPIDLLESFSTNFNVDIIGVSYEFKDGYVEAFELYANLEEEEMGSFLPIEQVEEGSDLAVESHFRQEDDILDEGDMLGMSDKELEEL